MSARVCYSLMCDRCGHVVPFRGATLQDARRDARTRFGWQWRKPASAVTRGLSGREDLCRECATPGGNQ